jgi:putative nucleotidyltransferase with HDIG domain
MATMLQMESTGFGDSFEERSFFKRSPKGNRTSGPIVTAKLVPATPQVMDSLGMGSCLDERIFFSASPTTREPSQRARLTARKAAANLMRAFVARGWEDEAHCERVASWSRRLARELGLSQERVLDVELGALLHDVGYINLRGIDFAKKGPLNAGEWFELRRHTELGVGLLQAIPALRRAIPLVANHHERFDGTGYPHGRKGNEIPIDARIFHLVDAYEAMTSDRSYHARMSDQDARADLERRVGTYFDPVVHAAFDCIDPSEWRELVASVG